MDDSVRMLLERMASGSPGPSAGSAAATAAALGAALAAKTARLSSQQLDVASEYANKADVLRDRALTLAEEDARGVRAMLSATPEAPADPSAIPREIADVAVAVRELAATLAERGNPRLHADAAAAECLAAAAERMIDGIIRSNARETG
ncbi:cyclodeaminase/cyclohydrolase family protein [Paramicrobacterium chengjingii]|uniref:Cyclodeaminase/cyclohydrolase family protein n=1 Tax=Paramicrobacterium chengjingii TaxID=2769067 RepID=A0ABX6YJ73_9MICO|nr:cyclodeaminase/cyclohydrolase family protein [Microbacterium chengjingii]QPZ38765.1 cyclodeaminase/cyclohydrolase family protein [Microbacterium chengjingii]